MTNYFNKHNNAYNADNACTQEKGTQGKILKQIFMNMLKENNWTKFDHLFEMCIVFCYGYSTTKNHCSTPWAEETVAKPLLYCVSGIPDHTFGKKVLKKKILNVQTFIYLTYLYITG